MPHTTPPLPATTELSFSALATPAFAARADSPLHLPPEVARPDDAFVGPHAQRSIRSSPVAITCRWHSIVRRWNGKLCEPGKLCGLLRARQLYRFYAL
jgi:hypothetical protein